jgi:aerobic-type carbon monoxide dehydrogenase small subunit (CoxS/CutS family)
MTRLFSNLKQINLEKKQDNLLSKLLILRSRVGKKKAKCSAATIELSGQAVLAISVSRSQ